MDIDDHQKPGEIFREAKPERKATGAISKVALAARESFAPDDA